ncbi:PocR ligand-binding domain-containing protein [Thermovibrio sp.]
MKKGRLKDFFTPEELGSLLVKFAKPVGASAMVWNESGKLLFYDSITEFCKTVYAKASKLCEEDRKRRFLKAQKLKKPFIHKCFAQKLNYVIPLIVKRGERELFIGIAGG